MTSNTPHNQPLSGMVTPRFAGMSTFMRLPYVPIEDARDIDVALIGVPWDGGTTNRPGARHGPRQIRDQSSMIREFHHVLEIAPYQLVNCADLGDAPVNPADLMDALERIGTYFRQVKAKGMVPLSAGGDHLVTLPILRALGADNPVGMVHFDAHGDTWDSYFGDNKFTHGTPFRRAVEEGVLDPKRTVQIGIRGSIYGLEDKEWALDQGIRVMEIEECVDLGPKAVAAEACRVVGDGETYVTFDIDCLDPAFAPGTGTPEIGGFTTREAQFMIRGLRGLNIIGADVVEISPPFDPDGATALAGATLMFELLCLIAESVSAGRDKNP